MNRSYKVELRGESYREDCFTTPIDPLHELLAVRDKLPNMASRKILAVRQQQSI